MIEIKHNLKEFVHKIEEQLGKSVEVTRKVLTEATEKTFKEIIDRTPVGNPSLWKHPYPPKGYKPGKLKKSWELLFYPAKNNFSGVFAVMHNPMPYAEVIEFGGHSTQAPLGMVRLSLQNYAKHIEDAIKRNKI